jgi:hypothetical protein
MSSGAIATADAVIATLPQNDKRGGIYQVRLKKTFRRQVVEKVIIDGYNLMNEE